MIRCDEAGFHHIFIGDWNVPWQGSKQSRVEKVSQPKMATPLQGTNLPSVDESDHKLKDEVKHAPEPKGGQLRKGDGPWEEKVASRSKSKE